MKSNKPIIHKQYIWLGNNAEGNKTKGEISAVTLNHAKLKLSRQGIEPHKIYKKPFLSFKRQHKKISSLEITLFFRQLATLVNSGVSIMQSCEMLYQTQHNNELQSLIATLKANIAAGKGLARGLSQFPFYFDELTCHLIQAGEQSGTFATMLTRIASHKENMQLFKNKIKQALFYPSMISIVALIITLLMLLFIVPRFAELFHTMHGSLPTITLGIFYLSDFLRHHSWLILFPISLSLLLHHYFKTSLRFRHIFDNVVLTTPFVKRYFQKMLIANFARNLAITFSAGMPILDAIKLIAPASGNTIFKQALCMLQNEISKGQQLHHAMQKNVLFPTLFVQMTKIGEEAGALENMLEKVAEIYEADVDRLMINLTHLLEPLIMVILGVLIGGLVIAMYLPIFKLGTML